LRGSPARAGLSVAQKCARDGREHQPGEQSEYLTQILNSRVDPAANPNATIYIFESKNDNKVTVLWTEGLQSLPADYAAK